MSEHLHQVAFFDWFRRCYPHVLAFAIPNGGHRHVAVGRKMKAEGVVSGVPDILIADGNPGCFIEMKVKPNKTTDRQKEVIKQLQQSGYHVAVCYGWEEAKTVAESYLGR